MIYHGGCQDGFCGAFLYWQYLKENGLPIPEFYPAKHGTAPPPATRPLMIDFMYPVGSYKDYFVIDHHKTNLAAAADTPDAMKLFDMNHSAAMLVWMWLYADDPPRLVKYVEDRDIWTKLYPESDILSSWLADQKYTFELFETLLDDANLDAAIAAGTAVRDHCRSIVEKNVKYGAVKFSKIGSKYYFVAYLNTVDGKSDMGNALMTRFPLCDFAAVYSIDDETSTTSFSLRSTDRNTDCSQIATQFGGGGHRNASGMKIYAIACTLPSVVFDSGATYAKLADAYVVDGVVYCNTDRAELGEWFMQEGNAQRVLGCSVTSYAMYTHSATETRFITPRGVKSVQGVHHTLPAEE